MAADRMAWRIAVVVVGKDLVGLGLSNLVPDSPVFLEVQKMASSLSLKEV